MKLVCTAALLAVLWAASPAHAARQAPLIEPERVTLQSPDGQPLTAEKVRNAILMGAQPLGWLVSKDTPGVLELSYNKQNKHYVVVRATYDERGYQLRYVSSTNLNYEVKTAGPEIHPNYNRWIQNMIAHIMIPGQVMRTVATAPVAPVIPAAAADAASR
ncbi:hypothetical protein EIP75_06075 [Aquabacterium soli]|uniref:Lipoprotein n=1 Tax=Aquabacterium soli TaxID=2493092 RepID=A0A426VE61_9BURK|nr:hypothetical protein [Aquabacterium soli]RRS05135.1 hypothetical protein EIP75_06075 [Aquabacterium soli]